MLEISSVAAVLWYHVAHGRVQGKHIELWLHLGMRTRLRTDDSMGLTLVKWVGGKSQLLPELRKHVPADLGTDARPKYVEPFVGGGAMLFDMLESYPSLRAIHANDLNKELINAYVVTRDEPDALMEMLRDGYAPDYLPLAQEDRAQVFYGWRNRLNELIDRHATDTIDDGNASIYGADSVEQAALFLAILRTCFNGLCRYNGDGHFNTPHGRYKNPAIFDEERIRSCSTALQPVTFHIGSYEAMERYVDNGTFLYADPPYREIPGKPSFKAYQKSGFNDDNQRELAAFLRRCSDAGAKVMTSNSDPHNGDPDDDFFDDLYGEWCSVDRVYARRAINSKGDGRGAITEILAWN